MTLLSLMQQKIDEQYASITSQTNVVEHEMQSHQNPSQDQIIIQEANQICDQMGPNVSDEEL